MTLVTTGLANGGLTTHYQVMYDDSLSKADGEERANALIEKCEADFNLMSGWFGGIALTVATPIAVQIKPGPYARAAWGPPIDLIPGDGKGLDVVRYLLVSEVTEMFMMAQNQGWFGAGNEGSAGEGLSRFLAGQFLIANGLGVTEPGFALANSWMNSPRADFVNNVDVGDHGIDAKTGCAILFVYYLFTQLGFSIEQIIAAAAPELSGVYTNLTGDAGDPFPFFKALLDEAFPGTTSIPGANPDNPWPLGKLSFWVDKSTFGRDEVTDMTTPPHTGVFPDAFWLVLEGFNRQVLGADTPALSGPALGFAGVSMPPDASGTEYERPWDQLAPQRVRFPFDVRFSSSSPTAFPAAGSSPAQEVLEGAITILGRAFDASTVLEFVAGADPYFTNIDPAQENVSWLSQDLRVFTATPSLSDTPVPGGPVFATDSFAGAYSYVQSLIAYLNADFADPTGTDPFNASSNVIPGQAGAYSGDSSVTPSTSSGGVAHANYNFAIARVRLRGTAGATEAQNVKVFFRMWGTVTADTDYQTGSTYPSHLDSRGLPDWPLPGPGAHTIPFFATSNSPSFGDPANPEYGLGGVNNQRIALGSEDTIWAYFGCFLNVYDSSNQVGGAMVQALLAGGHHCLVAQIAYDDAPILNAGGVTLSPNSSDKLAQRNLQVTHSDNPGSPATHLIPQTFDVRPSPVPIAGGDVLSQPPDELMIDWGETPPGSTASIYWPQVAVSEVLGLAARLYPSSHLSAIDPHTLRCTVTDGVTYVPIPPASGESFAGLLTIDLPPTVVRGQEFNVIVRRVSARRWRDVPVVVPGTEAGPFTPGTPRPPAEHPGAPKGGRERDWRRVVGTFQVKIPVAGRDAILPAEETALAIFKWRLKVTSPTNRWYPVLKRYVSYLSARVEGLGGNPEEIPPAWTEEEHLHGEPHGELVECTGRVVEVVYDCFGDLEEVVLSSCSARHAFRTREPAIGELALLACKERLRVSIYVERGSPHRIHRLVVRC